MIVAREKRAKSIRYKLSLGSPRLTVFRSNRGIYAQVVDDQKGQTIVSATVIFAGKGESRISQAHKVGMQIAEKLIAKKIERIVFDRGAYKYHGLVKAVADGAREGGVQF